MRVDLGETHGGVTSAFAALSSAEQAEVISERRKLMIEAFRTLVPVNSSVFDASGDDPLSWNVDSQAFAGWFIRRMGKPLVTFTVVDESGGFFGRKRSMVAGVLVASGTTSGGGYGSSSLPTHVERYLLENGKVAYMGSSQLKSRKISNSYPDLNPADMRTLIPAFGFEFSKEVNRYLF